MCLIGTGSDPANEQTLDERHRMSIERTFCCDGPECERHVRTTGTRPPMFLTVAEADHESHFCGWNCVLRYAAEKPPEVVIVAGDSEDLGAIVNGRRCVRLNRDADRIARSRRRGISLAPPDQIAAAVEPGAIPVLVECNREIHG